MDLLLLLKLIILGIVQGFTEPLPISSSGHLVLFGDMLGLSMQNSVFDNFLAITNFGSLIAVLLFYKKDIIDLVTKSFNYLFKNEKSEINSFKYLIYLIIATIPAGIMGLLFSSILKERLSNSLTVGIALLFTGLALLLINRAALVNNKENVSLFDSIIIGLAQVVALIPGISRSGFTVVAGLSRKLTFESALKFSFLMYIPISLAAGSLGVIDLLSQENVPYLGYLLGTIAAAFTTYFAIKFFISIVKKGKLIYFSIYCFVVGLIAIILL